MNMEKNIYEEPERLKSVEMSAIRAIMDKAQALRESGKKVISLSAGEPNFNTPDKIKLETIKAIEENYTHYGSNRGYPKLRRIISEQYKKDYNVDYDWEKEIVFTTGGAEALNNVILGTVNPGEEIIILSPAFVSYKNLVKMAGGVCVELPLREENDFHIDIEEVENAITSKTKMIIINNPNNPTGAVYSYGELKGLCELAIRHNLLILSDEMYSKLVYEGEFYTVASFSEMKSHAIIVNGFSKTYAMTGWRLGYIMADKPVIDNIMKVHQYSSTCSPTFIQVGMANAMELQDTQKEVEAMVDTFLGRRNLVLELLDNLEGITYTRSEGAFYCFINVSGAGFTGEEFAAELLDKKLVAVVPAVSLGKGSACKDYIRISFAASEDDIREGIGRIKELLTERV